MQGVRVVCGTGEWSGRLTEKGRYTGKDLKELCNGNKSTSGGRAFQEELISERVQNTFEERWQVCLRRVTQ